MVNKLEKYKNNNLVTVILMNDKDGMKAKKKLTKESNGP